MSTKASAEAARATKEKYKQQFYRHIGRAAVLAGSVIGVSLFLGILGYHYFAGLDWVDSLLNASMILSGMGPAAELKTDGAKIFASIYALFSGVVFISASGILLAPVFHRMLHKFHIEEKEEH